MKRFLLIDRETNTQTEYSNIIWHFALWAIWFIGVLTGIIFTKL